MEQPIAREHPATSAELVAIVKQAAATGRRMKVLGGGHSRDGMASTGGVRIVLDNYHRLLHVDRTLGRVTVQAGATLHRLAVVLAGWGLALEDTGGMPGQTLGGAISTGSHGHGSRGTGLADWVTGLDLVTAEGTVVSCSGREEPDIFDAARVGLGALGIISTVTLRCRPGFNLRSATTVMGLDDLLERFDECMDANDHTEFFWVPHTGVAVVTGRNRTGQPSGRVRWGRVDRAYRVAPGPRRLPEAPIEYSIPREAAVPTLQRVRELVARSRRTLPFPIRVCISAADDLPMSPASGRRSVFIGVGGAERAVGELLDQVGRPQWGRLHHQTAATLRPSYPRWDAWQAVRGRLDPDGRLANEWTDRVLG